jgi:hypothetical protein
MPYKYWLGNFVEIIRNCSATVKPPMEVSNLFKNNSFHSKNMTCVQKTYRTVFVDLRVIFRTNGDPMASLTLISYLGSLLLTGGMFKGTGGRSNA